VSDEGYRVKLDVFTGPLDLLLYLIRRDEVDVQDIPIVRVTDQYIEHVRVLEQLDPNAIGDFLVMASTLVELKSRALLPTPPLESEDDVEDPRAPLVRQLLEYKRFKDAAQALGHAADERARRYVRRPAALPKDLQGIELEEAEVWDLLKAFGKVMTAIGRGPGTHEINYDDTPIELHAAEIVAILEQEGPTTFASLFENPDDRMHIVGRFLALLDLIHQQRVRAEQAAPLETIYLFLLEEVEDSETEATVPPRTDDRPDAAPQVIVTRTIEATDVPAAPESAASADVGEQTEDAHEPAE
jgi:segregation and condensation protein A